MVEEKDIVSAKTRSPRFPYLSLGDAIGRVERIWAKDGVNAMSREVAVRHLGYQTRSGTANRVIASLNYYGLITDADRAGRIKLSQDSIYLMTRKSDVGYPIKLKAIALKPRLFKAIYEQYGGRLPSEELLVSDLIMEHEFSVDSAKQFVSVYSDTYDYAGLSSGEAIFDEGGDDSTSDEERVPCNVEMGAKVHQEPSKISGGITKSQVDDRNNSLNTYSLPLSGRNRATISFSSLPLSRKDVDKLKSWLELMGDTLSESDDSSE